MHLSVGTFLLQNQQMLLMNIVTYASAMKDITLESPTSPFPRALRETPWASLKKVIQTKMLKSKVVKYGLKSPPCTVL